jgi:hypothetical protein
VVGVANGPHNPFRTGRRRSSGTSPHEVEPIPPSGMIERRNARTQYRYR